MCIAFDGAYILEAPPADPGTADGHRPAPDVTPARPEEEHQVLRQVSGDLTRSP